MTISMLTKIYRSTTHLRSTTQLRTRLLMLSATALAGLALPWSLAYAEHSISEQRSANPEGVVEIADLGGSVEVLAWDRPQVEVTGTVEESTDSIEVTTTGNRTSINGVAHPGSHHIPVEARLIVHVPARSTVTATLVTGNLDVEGVQGDVRLHTVSGDIKGSVKGDVRVSTVSGAVHMAALDARTIEVKTISGDIELTGGNGDVEVGTVSGSAKVYLGTVTRARLKSISGDLMGKLALSPDARLEGESVSGDVDLEFASAPDTQFDVQSFSGEIKNCFGPKPTKSDYGTGSKLTFGGGDARGRVRIATQSGGIKLCTKNLHARQAAPFLSPVSSVSARATNSNIFYVL